MLDFITIKFQHNSRTFETFDHKWIQVYPHTGHIQATCRPHIAVYSDSMHNIAIYDDFAIPRSIPG